MKLERHIEPHVRSSNPLPHESFRYLWWTLRASMSKTPNVPYTLTRDAEEASNILVKGAVSICYIPFRLQVSRARPVLII